MSVFSLDRSRVSGDEYQFNGFYACQWFAGKKLEEGRFREPSLIEVK